MYATFVQIYNLIDHKKEWTDEEDKQLSYAVKLFGESKDCWNQIANHLDGRSTYSCFQRWFKYVNPCIIRGKW